MEVLQIGFLVFYFIVALISCGYLVLRKHYSFWADRGIVHNPPVFFYGNLYDFRRTTGIREPILEVYNKFKHVAPFCGFYLFFRRAVVLFDLELIKNVLIKDFANFSHRGNYYNAEDDPLSGHLFNLDGPKWKAMRAKLTPTFTSGKMKFMFTTVVDVAEQFVALLTQIIDKETKNDSESKSAAIEARELLARFTTDVIGSCAFGINCNSLKDPDTQFRVMGKKVFTKRRHNGLVFGLMTAFPNVARKLGMKTTTKDVESFFLEVVRDTVSYREREKVHRNDFMNLLIELKNKNELEGLTIEEIAAQAFVFFLAGFETSSSTMSFSLYELAMNQDIQDKARVEIDEMFERHNGKFTYEGFLELKYLKRVLHETMRMYSVASFVLRKTIDDYKVPGTNYIIEKDIVVVIPIDAIHRDPDIYPDAEKFDPTRFEADEIEKRHSMSWLPFGDGPRNCIGLRFGEMQSLIGLALLLKNFKITPSPQTKIPLEMDPKTFILTAKDGIVLNFEKIPAEI